MEKDAVLVCTIVGFLRSVAIILGFVADSYSSKGQSVRYNGTSCVHGSTPAVGCGILGVLLVLIDQVIVTAYTSSCCLCCCWTKRRRALPPSKRRRLGVILSVFSWILTIVAAGMFIGGVSESSESEKPPVSTTPTSYTCEDSGTTRLFATASLSSLIAVVSGIASYVLLETAAPPPHGQLGQEFASTGQQAQPQPRPTAGADQEAEHISQAAAV